MVAFGIWSLLILFSTRNPSPIPTRSWFESLKLTANEWLIWMFLAPVVIRLDRWLPVSRNALFQRFLYHIPLGLGMSTFAILLRELTTFAGEKYTFSLSFEMLEQSWTNRFHIHVLMYWLIIGTYMLFEYNTQLKEQELQTSELQRLLTEARLNALRSQMHPHFLFNALNTISAHVERDPRSARRMLEQLGELLRFSLDYSQTQKIPLSEEIGFINRYLALQKARFEERLEVNITLDPETLNALVPTFILEPLVENAIRHGIATRSQKGVVEILAKKEKNELHLTVRDDGPGLSPDWDLERDAGIGINNTHKSLRFFYGEKSSIFNITNAEGGGVIVDLLLPLQYANVNGLIKS